MSLVATEGFELQGALFSGAYEEFSGNLTPTFSNPGRVSGFSSNLEIVTAYRDVLSTVETDWVFGLGIYMDSSKANDELWVSLGVGPEHAFTALFDSNGSSTRLRFRNGGASAPLISVGSITETLIGGLDTWIYVEIKVTLSTTVGTLEVRLEGSGAPVLNGTNLNTVKGSLSAGARTLGLHTTGAGRFDDMWWATQDATAPNNFLGKKQVVGLALDSIGALSDFSPTGAASNLAAVTDGTDATYNQASTLADQDLFNIGDLSALTSTVDGIEIRIRASTGEIATRDLQIVAREGGGGSETLGPAISLASVRPSTKSLVLSEKPSGGAWTVGVADTLQVGYRIGN